MSIRSSGQLSLECGLSSLSDLLGGSRPLPGVTCGKYYPRRDWVLGGKYRLLSPVAEGGMGVVWRAEHLTLGVEVAVKLMQGALQHDPSLQESFFQEARITASLRSPHVVQILDFGIQMHSPYIAMELLEGESLSQCLRRGGPLGFRQLLGVLDQVAEALSVAHERGVVHCDVKPENVFLVRAPFRAERAECCGGSSSGARCAKDDQFVKVIDFGIARPWALARRNESFSAAGAQDEWLPGEHLVGTPMYMSPEQRCGAACSPMSDVWALGVLAFECLVGRPPFESPGQRTGAHSWPVLSLPRPSRWASVPRGFDDWFARSCHQLPERRFSSARDASYQLGRLLVARTNEHSASHPLPAL